MSIRIGNYDINYTEEELKGLPSDIFLKCKTDEPFIYEKKFLGDKAISFFYNQALTNFNRRQFASVHDYSGGVESSRVDINGRYTHYIPVSDYTYRLLDDILYKSVVPLLNSRFDLTGRSVKRTEGWQFLGYGENYFFSNHCDNCVPSSISPNEEDRNNIWWCNTPTRKLTVIFYANSQNNYYPSSGEYSGGDLTLNRISSNGETVRINPIAGTLVAFPSNFLYSHEVHRITKGYRFSIVTWLDLV